MNGTTSGHIYFEIQTADPQRASDFYKELFGWTFRKLYGVPVEYSQGYFMDTEGNTFGLFEVDEQAQP